MEDELQPRLSQRLHISKPDDATDNSLHLKPIPGYVVAVMEPVQRQAEFTALFAAAPELLAVLEDIMKYQVKNDSMDLPIWVRAKEALAKAKWSDLCVECKQPTNFGSGRFVNRTANGNGWLCPDCLYPENCFFCEEKPPMDDEIYCEDCSDDDDPGYEETNDLLEAATEAMNPVGGDK